MHGVFLFFRIPQSIDQFQGGLDCFLATIIIIICGRRIKASNHQVVQARERRCCLAKKLLEVTFFVEKLENVFDFGAVFPFLNSILFGKWIGCFWSNARGTVTNIKMLDEKRRPGKRRRKTRVAEIVGQSGQRSRISRIP